MADALIQLQQLTRTYQRGSQAVTALAGIDLQIEAGEFLGVAGPSGSGKSTLLNLLGGLDSPTAGRILVGGRDIATFSRKALASYRRRQVGMVFQSFQLVGGYTAAENVALPLLFAGADRRQRMAVAAEALEQVGLADRAGHRPGELSGGQQQRVAVARALAARPEILLADEPTGNLDSAGGEQIMELLTDLNRRLGVTIVLITHEQPLLERFAGRAVRLRDGRVESDRKIGADA